jgi:hypothetical protein
MRACSFALGSGADRGNRLRTGSANFSRSREQEQNNDLIIIREPEAARKFETRFEKIWDSVNLGRHNP